MTPADQLLTRVAELARKLGVPFALAVHDTVTGTAKLAAAEGVLEKLKPFLLRQLGVEAATQPEEEIQEVGWNDDR